MVTMKYGTTRRENKMTSAKLFIGMGEDAELVATLGRDGSTADMDDAGLFGPKEGGLYTERDFRDLALEALMAQDLDTLETVTNPDMIYVFKNGSILVFERGTDDEDKIGYYQVALHYPNGARKPVPFPGVA